MIDKKVKRQAQSLSDLDFIDLRNCHFRKLRIHRYVNIGKEWAGLFEAKI